MKKLLAILAVCFVMVSCQWWHETFSSPEDCAKWYAEQLADAYLDGDAEKATELLLDMYDWYEGLDAKDQAIVDRYMDSFGGSDDYGYDEYDDYGW